MSDHVWHLNFTDGFEGEGFALDLNNGSQTLSKPFFSLTLGRAFHLQTFYFTNVFSEEEPRHCLIYRYITAVT